MLLSGQMIFFYFLVVDISQVKMMLSEKIYIYHTFVIVLVILNI